MKIRSTAPLRLGFGGGGTDVEPYCSQFTGCVLNSTISLRVHCFVEPTADGSIVLEAIDLGKREVFQATDRIDQSAQLVLHAAVYNRIVKDFTNGEPMGIHIATYSDVPAGSGLGTSSTLTVAMLKAMIEYLNLPMGDYDVARLAYKIERIDCGLLGGAQDQYAATFGGVNFMEFYGEERVVVNPLRIKRWIMCELDASLVLYFSGVSRESANIIKEQVDGLAKPKSKSTDALHEIKENAYVMKDALLTGNLDRFTDALGSSWAAKKKVADNMTSASIDEAYDAAIRAGAKAGKISGAGGGGFMMLMCEPIKRANVIKALSEFPGTVRHAYNVDEGMMGWRVD